jgi:hypothetical protein
MKAPGEDSCPDLWKLKAQPTNPVPMIPEYFLETDDKYLQLPVKHIWIHEQIFNFGLLSSAFAGRIAAA